MDLLLLSSLASCTFTFMAVASAAAVVYYLIPYWRVRSVPGPPTIPFLGHLPLLAMHGPDVFAILANKYRPIYRFHLGRQPLVIVADPELCREVGIKRFKSIGNRSLPSPISGSPLHQKGLFFTRDSKWASARNTIVSLYQPSHLASLVPTMQSYITSAFSNLCTTTKQEPQEVTFNHITLKLTTDVIGQSAFGVDFGLSKEGDSKHVTDDEASAFIKEHMYAITSLKMDLTGSFSIILGLLFPILQEPFRQLLKRIPGTADWKIEQTNQNLTARIGDIVAKRACNRDRNGKDFLSAILGTRESSKYARDLFTSDYISALTYEHLLAGSATTSFTLSSVLYLVSKHPRVEEKLLQEIDSFGPSDLNPNAEDLNNKFPYLDQMIKESMRYYTVSPLVARETSQKVQVGGYVLPKGTWIWLAIGVLAKDPKNFPQPHEFHPERFDPNCEEEKARHPYAHIPFGIGPRACIGQKFALLEIKLALIHLYRRYRFKHSPNMEFPLEFEFGIVLNFKNGIKLHVTERTT